MNPFAHALFASGAAAHTGSLHGEALNPWILLMGLAGGAIGRFLPLFAEEELGYSLAIAGLAASLGGLLGMGFRIMAARIAETRLAPTPLLVRLSGTAVVSSALLALSVTQTRTRSHASWRRHG